MHLHTNTWPSTSNAKNYKIFSEVMLELMHRSSWESYRCHTLSTIMKCTELRVTLGKVQRKEVGKNAISPQLDELRHAIKNDPILNLILIRKNIPLDAFNFALGSSTERLLASARLFEELFSKEYQEYCQKEIIRICRNQDSSEKLITVTKLYAAHIVNIGYSKEFVFLKTKQTFYQDDVKRCSEGLLRRFFENFSTNMSHFDIYFCANTSYLQFLKNQFSFSIYEDMDKAPSGRIPGIPQNFGEGGKKGILLVPDVSSKDPFSSLKSVETLFSIIRSFLYLHPKNVHVKRDHMAYVVNTKTKEVTYIRLDKSFEPRRASASNREHAKLIENLARYVFSDSDKGNSNFNRTLSSLSSISLAAKAPDPESRLLSIWSAFEALMPDPMKDGEGIVRITHFSSLITPCAVFNYLPATFSECYRNCSLEFGQPFVEAVNHLGIGDTELEKFISIFISDLGSKRALCDEVKASPLMLMRFMRLEKLVANPKEACKYLETHEQRVLWQINRIYRERNSIVHKAAPSPFVSSLIENAYTYFRSVFLNLEMIYKRYGVSDPDQGLLMMESLYSEYKKNLNEISSNSSRVSTADRNQSFVRAMLDGSVFQ